MNRHSVNIALNGVLFAVLVCLALSGFVMDFALEHGHGRGGGEGGQWLGVGRHGWTELHSICAYLFVAACLAHFWLHWSWIKQVLLGGSDAPAGRRTVGMAGLGLALVLLVSALALPFVVPGGVGADGCSGDGPGGGGRHLGGERGGPGYHGGWERAEHD